MSNTVSTKECIASERKKSLRLASRRIFVVGKAIELLLNHMIDFVDLNYINKQLKILMVFLC